MTAYPDRECEAPDCDVRFTPQRSTAKYCSATCRQRAGRARQEPAEPASEGDAESGLVAAIRAELETAGRLDTYPGQLAMQLAQRLTRRDETGISSLSKELRTVMASALEGVTPPASAETEVDDDDPVARAEDELARKRVGRTG